MQSEPHKIQFWHQHARFASTFLGKFCSVFDRVSGHKGRTVSLPLISISRRPWSQLHWRFMFLKEYDFSYHPYFASRKDSKISFRAKTLVRTGIPHTVFWSTRYWKQTPSYKNQTNPKLACRSLIKSLIYFQCEIERFKTSPHRSFIKAYVTTTQMPHHVLWVLAQSPSLSQTLQRSVSWPHPDSALPFPSISYAEKHYSNICFLSEVT